MQNILMKDVYDEIVSPQEYIDLYTRDRSEIKRVRILPPSGEDFGKIVVTHKTPKYIRDVRKLKAASTA